MFYITQRGITPQNTSVSEPLRSWPLSCETRSNTITLFIVKSVAGMDTHLTLNYANFAPLNVWDFAPLHVWVYYATLMFAPLNVWAVYIRFTIRYTYKIYNVFGTRWC